MQPTPEYYFPEATPPPPVAALDRASQPGSADHFAPPYQQPPMSHPPAAPQPQQPSNASSLMLVALVGLLAGAALVLGALLVFG